MYDIKAALCATCSGEKFYGIKCGQITISRRSPLKIYARSLSPDAGIQSGVDGGIERSNTLHEPHKVLQLAGKP
jgi:hypothetical protein